MRKRIVRDCSSCAGSAITSISSTRFNYHSALSEIIPAIPTNLVNACSKKSPPRPPQRASDILGGSTEHSFQNAARVSHRYAERRLLNLSPCRARRGANCSLADLGSTRPPKAGSGAPTHRTSRPRRTVPVKLFGILLITDFFTDGNSEWN